MDVAVVVAVLTLLAVGYVSVVEAVELSVTHTRTAEYFQEMLMLLFDIYRHVVTAYYVHLLENNSLYCVKIE